MNKNSHVIARFMHVGEIV